MKKKKKIKFLWDLNDYILRLEALMYDLGGND